MATKQTEEKTNKTNTGKKKKIGKIPFFTQSPCRRWMVWYKGFDNSLSLIIWSFLVLLYLVRSLHNPADSAVSILITTNTWFLSVGKCLFKGFILPVKASSSFFNSSNPCLISSLFSIAFSSFKMHSYLRINTKTQKIDCIILTVTKCYFLGFHSINTNMHP